MRQTGEETDRRHVTDRRRETDNKRETGDVRQGPGDLRKEKYNTKR